MRKTLWSLGVLVLLAAAPLSFGEECSCTAPDGSCNAGINCTGGCMAICGNGGNCSASCSGAGSRPVEEHQGLRTGPGALRSAPGAPGDEVARASVEAIDIGPEDVSTLLSNLTGREITFVPNVADERLSLTAKNFPVEQLVAQVAKYGAIGSHPRRIIAGALGLDDLVSLQAKNVTASALAGMVESLSGGRATLTPVDPEGALSLEVKSVRLRDLLAHLTVFGEVVVDGQRLERP